MMRPVSFLLTLVVLAGSWRLALAADDTEKIVGVWERFHEKTELEETWTIKKTQGKWSVSGTYVKAGNEVGNFRGKDVKYADDTLSFTQSFFKLPPGMEDGAKITASADGDRLDITAVGKSRKQTKDNMTRAGDGSELLGTWKGSGTGAAAFTQIWTIKRGKNGELVPSGIVQKDNMAVGSWHAGHVRYFEHILIFHQIYDKLPGPRWAKESTVNGKVFGDEFRFVWDNGKIRGKGRMTREVK